ncbi:MAG TPA: hypothetical protein VF989_18495 [Polyangiaceae bacterium]
MKFHRLVSAGIGALVCVWSGAALAEEERTANNSIYIEGLGPGLLYSLNYDRAFNDLAVRIGFGYLSLSASAVDENGVTTANASIITVPLTASYIGIGETHVFEVGGGVTLMHFGAGISAPGVDDSTASATVAVGTLIIGYRLQPKDGGFNFRVGVSPLLGIGADSFGFLPWPYLSLGGTF